MILFSSAMFLIKPLHISSHRQYMLHETRQRGTLGPSDAAPKTPEVGNVQQHLEGFSKNSLQAGASQDRHCVIRCAHIHRILLWFAVRPIGHEREGGVGIEMMRKND